MKRRLVLIITAICILLSGISVSAETDRKTIGVWAFAGKLFYCDMPTSRVVIKNVVPLASSADAQKTAKEAEYLEIKVSPDGLRMNDGSSVAIHELNTYVDSNVWFVIQKAADGYLSIPYFAFK